MLWATEGQLPRKRSSDAGDSRPAKTVRAPDAEIIRAMEGQLPQKRRQREAHPSEASLCQYDGPVQAAAGGAASSGAAGSGGNGNPLSGSAGGWGSPAGAGGYGRDDRPPL
eukprot:7334804-Pyramimonas_sp.AAC.1